MFDIEGFKRQEFVVHCENQNQCIIFLTFLSDNNIFVNGCETADFVRFSARCNNEPCFSYQSGSCMHFCDLAYYQKHNYQIKTFNDCFANNRAKIKIMYLGI